MLTLENAVFDPSLLISLATIWVFNILFSFLLKTQNYLRNDIAMSNGILIRRVIIGGIISGFGLGLGGMGVTTATLNCFHLTHTIVWIFGLVAGYALVQFLDNKFGK